MVLGVCVLFIPLSCFSFYPSIFVLSFSDCFMLGWVGWIGAITSLHLHTHLLLRHIFFILLRHMNFSSTSTSSSHYVIHFSCCYVLRSSLALPYLLLVTVRYIMFLRLRHKNLFCKSTTTSRYVTWITWCFVTRTSLESMIRHHNYLVLLIQVQAILQNLCLNMYM